MTTLFDYYRKKIDEDGNIVFEKVKEEDIKICGKRIEEVITILNGLDIEKRYQIEMTMENLIKYKEIIDAEINKQLEESLNRQWRNFKEED